jgi:aspartyl-tRNA(Asn)/glutamyl-tRNA(Gln) amidotransferase subunit A
MTYSDLCFLSAGELSPLIAKGEISPVEVTKALLARIASLNEKIRAYIHVCENIALSAAKQAEGDIRNGNHRGPLHGIPVAYKDIYDVADLPTTAGSKLLKAYIASKDSTVAKNLRAAGAVCLGKLNTWEFASGSMAVFGESRNPWNTDCVTAGSSSGSGAALAARMVTVAAGSDTGGSVRMPSAFCGIVGLKPTFERISTAGIVPLSVSLDHAGPMARTVNDVAMLFSGMLGEKFSEKSLTQRDSLKGVRIGLPSSYFFDNLDSEVEKNVRLAVECFENLGASVESVDLPFTEYGAAASFTIAYTDAYGFHRRSFFKRAADYTPTFLCKIAAAAFLSGEDLHLAQKIRNYVAEGYRKVLTRVDVILTPMAAYPAHPIGSSPPQPNMRSFARPISLTGLPAMSVPCGFTTSGLPVGMQLVGRSMQEQTLFQIADAYENATGWPKQIPPLKGGSLRKISDPEVESSVAIDAQWIMDAAKLNGMTYVTTDMADSIASHVNGVKAKLNEARNYLLETEAKSTWGI